MVRREYKFLIPSERLSELRSMILPLVEPDPFAASRPGNEYTVRSLYFDTPKLDFYEEKRAGLRERKKVRIRGYNHVTGESPVFLEIKRKNGPYVTKQRSMVRFQDLGSFLATSDTEKYINGTGPCENPKENANQFLFYFHTLSLAPVITVVYEREAYVSKIDHGVRITIDKKLRSDERGSLESLARDAEGRHALPKSLILEVKTQSELPHWLQLLLGRMDATRDALCKYVICVDAQRIDGNGLALAHPLSVRTRTMSTETGQ